MHEYYSSEILVQRIERIRLKRGKNLSQPLLNAIDLVEKGPAVHFQGGGNKVSNPLPKENDI